MTSVLVKYFQLKRKAKAVLTSKPGPILNEDFLRRRFVDLICRDFDLRETYGKNRHNTIDNINIRMKLPLGSAYCLSGLLVRGVADLCTELNLYNPIPMNGSTQKWFEETMGPYTNLSFKDAKMADICILQKMTNMTAGHGYTLTAPPILAHAWIHNTAEYNTNKEGSADGEGFHLLSRIEEDLKTMRFRGSVDVIKWIMKENNLWKN